MQAKKIDVCAKEFFGDGEKGIVVNT